jgi:ATP phosphoribosyltransferase
MPKIKRKKVRLGLPKGSLNHVERANTYQLFIRAGYDIQGYLPGNEEGDKLLIANDPEISPFLIRPQNAATELKMGFLDAAISGEDWMEEFSAYDFGIKKVGDLEYSRAGLVVAVSKNTPYSSLDELLLKFSRLKRSLILFTEYIYLAQKTFTRNKTYQRLYRNKPPKYFIRNISGGENEWVKIFHSDGLTEAYIMKGADAIVDLRRTGMTMDKYGLKPIHHILDTSVGLYSSSSCQDWKIEKIKEIYQRLKGVIGTSKF